MDEYILIEFRQGGKIMPVTGVRTTRPEPHENGIVVNGETSAFPRGFDLGLYPDMVTKPRVEAVQRRLDWLNPSRFEVEIAREGERLRIEGVDAKALPPGGYTVRMRVDGLALTSAQPYRRIPGNGSTNVVFEAKAEDLKFRLNRPVEEFDENSRRILGHSKSKLDGLGAAEWLTADNGQDRRKAALLNILAKLSAVPVAKKNESLSWFVKHVFHAQADRIYCAVRPEFFDIVQERFHHDPLVHPTHYRLFSRIPAKQADRAKLKDRYNLQSYREEAPTSSLQVVVAKPKEGPPDTLYVDIDIDKANPSYDALRFMLHVGDLISSKTTNHLKLRKGLAGGATADFLYYDAVKV